VKHLAGDTESLGCRHYGQANRGQYVFLENLTRMNGRQCALFLHNVLLTRAANGILKIDVQCGFVVPAEGDPIIPGYPHRPSFRFAFQAMEVKPGYVQLIGLACDFQQLQDANALPDMIGANPAGCAGDVNLLKSLCLKPSIILGV